VPAPVLGAGHIFDLSLGFDYSTGDYGAETDTEILYFPVSLKWETGRLAFKATVPYLRLTTSGNVVGGGSDIISTGGPTGEDANTESGLGDINISASYFLFPGTGTLPMLDVTAKFKVPTADEEKGLGTGAADVTFELDASKVFEHFFMFGTLGYKIYGDPPGIVLDNVFLASIGIGRRVTEKSSAGLIYDARQASTPSGSPMSEATAYLSYRLTRNFRLLPYFLKGFSDGSPDYGLGLSFSTIFALEELKRFIPSLEHPRK